MSIQFSPTGKFASARPERTPRIGLPEEVNCLQHCGAELHWLWLIVGTDGGG